MSDTQMVWFLDGWYDNNNHNINNNTSVFINGHAN